MDTQKGKRLRFNLLRTKAVKRSLLKEKMSRIRELREENELYKNSAKRIAAEFDNYRKRTEAEKERLIKEAGERIIKKMIPFFESIELALKNIYEKEEDNEDNRIEKKAEKINPQEKESIIEGIKLLYNQMKKVLMQEGIEFINQTNVEFNPRIHEAIQTKEDKKNAGKVLNVLQQGVKLHDKILRPARVIVAVCDEDKKHTQKDNQKDERKKEK